MSTEGLVRRDSDASDRFPSVGKGMDARFDAASDGGLGHGSGGVADKGAGTALGVAHGEGGGPGIGFVLAWVALASATVAISFGWKEAVIDDAYIAFRYAANLAEGHGLVFNPGERVEGFTSPLFTLLMALAIRLGFDPPGVAQWINVSSNVTLLGAVYLFARHTFRHSPYVSLIAPALLVANFNFGGWAAHGLETSLFALLVFVGLALSLPADPLEGSSSRRGVFPRRREAVLGAFVLALATWTRPEAPLYFGIAFLPRLARLLKAKKPSRADVEVALVFLVPVLALIGARWAYYGALLPNTYYAKATGGAGKMGDGLRYTLRFFDQSLIMGLVLVPLSGIVMRWRRGARPYLLLTIASTTAYVILVGGDAFGAARFFVPILAPLYLLVEDGLATLLVARPLFRMGATLFFAFLGLGTIMSSGPAEARQVRIAAQMTLNRAFLGRLLSVIMPPESSIALNTVGALPYYAGLETIDLYGLTDAHIAHVEIGAKAYGETGHQKGDGDYVLERKPTAILLRNVWLADVPIEDHRVLHGLSEHQIAASPVFESDYEAIDIPVRDDLVFGFYLRKDAPRALIEARARSVDMHRLGPVERLASERGEEFIYFERGAALLNAGQAEAAIRAFSRAIALYPKEPRFFEALGHAYARLGRNAQALGAYREAVGLDARRAASWLGIGNIQTRLGKLDRAVEAYKEAIRADSTLVEARTNLATILLKQGRFDEAIPVLQGALAQNPKDVETWVKLGTAAATLRQWDVARGALEQALSLAPSDPRVQALKRFVEQRMPGN